MGLNKKDIGIITVFCCVHSIDDIHDQLFCYALKSIQFQTYQHFDIIIVLDGCTHYHKSKLIIEELSKSHNMQVLTKEKKTGLADVKNYGLSHVNHPYPEGIGVFRYNLDKNKN